MESRIKVPKMYKLFIGGKFTRTESERYIEIFNPKTKEKICNVSRASRKDLKNAVTAARSGFSAWSSKTAYERSQIIYRFAEMLEGRKTQFAEEIFISSIQTKQRCIKEISVSIDRIIYFAGFADKWMQIKSSINPVQSGYFNFSIPEPTGVVAIILPDEPFLLPAISRILTVITSGNSCIVLSGDKSPLPLLTLSEVIATSDFPAGVINILTGYRTELIEHIAGHYEINAIDYCDNNKEMKKKAEELSTNNVKRFHALKAVKEWDWYSDELNENLEEIEKFTEIKTVWQTM